MHKAFPLLGESFHWQYKFPLPVEGVPTARRMEIQLPGVCTAMMKKLPVKEKWQNLTDSFFKAYDVRHVEKGNEQRQMKRNDNNHDDKQPNKKVCRTEKFEAIKYSLGPNEEYIAVRRCEYDTLERN
nr:hypothetical protein [Tanacetum cinerariifolium]